jgi:hypothetical protein
MLPTLMSVIICLGSRVTCVQAWDFAPALVVGSGGGGGGDAANGYEGCGGGGSGGRARSHCRFVLPFPHFIPDSRIHSVPRVLRRQCDRTLGSIWLKGATMVVAGTVSAVGGAGGVDAMGGVVNNDGGAGGDGRIKVEVAGTGGGLAVLGTAVLTPAPGSLPGLKPWVAGGTLNPTRDFVLSDALSLNTDGYTTFSFVNLNVRHPRRWST